MKQMRGPCPQEPSKLRAGISLWFKTRLQLRVEPYFTLGPPPLTSKEDLPRQLKRLRAFAAGRGLAPVEVVGETGSGLNAYCACWPTLA
jgi:hypothetical protein